MIKKNQLKILLLIIIATSSIEVYTAERTLLLTGMKIFRDDEIINKLSLPRRPLNSLPAHRIIRKIRNFYISRGYTVVKIYIIENSRKKLSLYIDEGNLARVVFLNVNTLKTLKLKYNYRVRKNVFNIKSVKKIVREIKQKENFSEVTYRLIPSEKYDETYFQLDRKLNLPVIGKTQLPFFSRYGSRFRLEFYITGMQTAGDEKKNGYIDYNLHSSYTNGLIPEVIFSKQGIFNSDDRFRAGTSAGIMYGLDGKFKNPPHMKFFEGKVNYHFSPFFQEIFTPHIYSRVYRSKSSRNDLGILTYNYWLIRSVFAPGITLLKRLEIFSGFGIEHNIQSQSTYDEDKTSQTVIEEGVQKIPFVELGMTLRRTPFDFLKISRQNIKGTYSYYYQYRIFHEIEIKGESKFKLPRKTIYHIFLEYNRLWGDVPFYHEKAVSSRSFKGFMSKSYHSWNVVSVANELRTSILREFIYIGLYIDETFFKGSGYDLTGRQFGIVAGPILRLIVLDQFEIYISYGKDLLFSTGESEYNISFGLKKKW
jgi:hypothetical protein